MRSLQSDCQKKRISIFTQLCGLKNKHTHSEKQSATTTAPQTIWRKATSITKKSNEGSEFLSLGEPIKVGHHSANRHRALIERNWDRMGKKRRVSRKNQRKLNKGLHTGKTKPKK